jgi:hypothetical protein
MDGKTVNKKVVGAEGRQIHVMHKGKLHKVGLGITPDTNTSELIGKTVLIKYMKNDEDILYAPIYMGVNEILTRYLNG